jgi:autotransporter-associated beta strand protein
MKMNFATRNHPSTGSYGLPLRIIPAALGLILALLANHAEAAFTSWDPQGSNPQNPYTSSLSGTWENANWDTADQLGTSPTAAWVENTTALFAINSGTGTPAFTVTMAANHTVAGIYDGGQTPGPCPVTINGSGSMTLPSGSQTFNVVSPGTLTISNVVTGSGALVQSGSGTLTLSGVNTYSGGTTIGSGGALTIGGPGKLGNGSYAGAITNAGTLTWSSTSSQTLSGVISGAGQLIQNGSGALTLTTNNTYTGATTLGAGRSLTIGNSGKLGNGTYAGAITNNGIFSYNGTNSLTFTGIISGAGGLVVNPNQLLGSLLYLKGANTYSGSTTIGPAGQVILYSDSSLGTPPANFTANQLTLEYGFVKASATFTLNAKRGITLVNVGVPVGGSIQVDPSQTLTLASPITGPTGILFGSGEATFGFGTNLLTATNTYTGPTGISTGRLMLGVNGALPYGTTLIIAADNGSFPPGAIFDLGGYNQTIGPLASTNAFFGNAGSGTPTIVLNGALTVLHTNTANVFNGIITGSGSLTISGNSSGKLTLGMANSYTGLTTINGGTLDGSVSGTIPGNVTVNGGTLELDDPAAMSSAATLTLPGTPAAGMVNLSFFGTQTISALYFGPNAQATGTWGGLTSGADNTNATFTGTGLLLVCPTPDQTITPAAASVCAGATTTASVTVTPGATYSWSVNYGTILSGGTNSTVTYSAWVFSPVTLNCVVTSACGVQSAGGQNVNVTVNICGLVVQTTNVVYDAVNGATITGMGVMGAGWYLNATNDVTAPLPWPTIQSGTVYASPFTVNDPTATNTPQQFYYLTNSP